MERKGKQKPGHRNYVENDVPSTSRGVNVKPKAARRLNLRSSNDNEPINQGQNAAIGDNNNAVPNEVDMSDSIDENSGKNLKSNKRKQKGGKITKGVICQPQETEFSLRVKRKFNEKQSMNNGKLNNDMSKIVDHEDDGINLRVRTGEDDFGDTTVDSGADSDIDDTNEDDDDEQDTEVGVTTLSNEGKSRKEDTFSRDEFVKLTKNAEFRKLMKEMVDEELDEREKEREQKRKRSEAKATQDGNNNIIKSPSDTTLYTPALRKGIEANSAVHKISEFVENIRLETQHTSLNSTGHKKQSEAKSKTAGKHRAEQVDNPEEIDDEQLRNLEHDEQNIMFDEMEEDPTDAVKKLTDKVVLEAEQKKAILSAPKGMVVNKTVQMLRKLDNDDDFFHSTCHIDDSLRDKIERGQFVDLDKLLPKDRVSGGFILNDFDDPPVQLIKRGNSTFLGSAVKETKITGMRKWDQAFRVYTTIYCEANPNRSSEILQYVDIMHTIAAAYPWDCVVYYDIAFRQLMAAKPWRSWAKTYTQGWNLALRGRTGDGVSAGGSMIRNNKPGSSGNSSGAGSSADQSWKKSCCWRFNKNRCNKSASACDWDHRCSHCAGWYHSYNNCRKRLGNGNGKPGQNSNQQKSGNGNLHQAPPAHQAGGSD